jgi:hypothetical protein
MKTKILRMELSSYACVTRSIAPAVTPTRRFSAAGSPLKQSEGNGKKCGNQQN